MIDKLLEALVLKFGYAQLDLKEESLAALSGIRNKAIAGVCLEDDLYNTIYLLVEYEDIIKSGTEVVRDPEFIKELCRQVGIDVPQE